MGPCIKNDLHEYETDPKFDLKCKETGTVFDIISDGY